MAAVSLREGHDGFRYLQTTSQSCRLMAQVRKTERLKCVRGETEGEPWGTPDANSSASARDHRDSRELMESGESWKTSMCSSPVQRRCVKLHNVPAMESYESVKLFSTIIAVNIKIINFWNQKIGKWDPTAMKCCEKKKKTVTLCISYRDPKISNCAQICQVSYYEPKHFSSSISYFMTTIDCFYLTSQILRETSQIESSIKLWNSNLWAITVSPG